MQRPRQPLTGPALIQAALAGDRRAMARLLSLVENGTSEGRVALAELFPRSGNAHVIGFTGSTGSGKSTLVGRVAQELRRRGLGQASESDVALAVVAVDPTSPYSGGALLGDRLRMRSLSEDTGIFIRSMASRGHPGGVAHATRDVVTVLDALGIPLILLETVGAGQAQVEVARVAHTVVLVEAPGMGDDVQALKAGLMEVADVIVVNKADRPEAKQTLHALRGAPLQHHHRFEEAPKVSEEAGQSGTEWEVPILETSALEGTGVEALVDAITAHRHYLLASSVWAARRADHARAELEAWLQRYLSDLVATRLGTELVEAAVDAIVRRERDPASAARDLLEVLVGHLRADPDPRT